MKTTSNIHEKYKSKSAGLNRFKKTEFLTLNEFVHTAIIKSQEDEALKKLFLKIELTAEAYNCSHIFPSLCKAILDWKSQNPEAKFHLSTDVLDYDEVSIELAQFIVPEFRQNIHFVFELVDFIYSQENDDFKHLIKIIADHSLNFNYSTFLPF